MFGGKYRDFLVVVVAAGGVFCGVFGYFKCLGVVWCANVQICRCADVQMCRCADVQMGWRRSVGWQPLTRKK